MFWREEDPLSSQYVDGESEALQTDIQRFIAILGFCLMAVLPWFNPFLLSARKKIR